MTDTTLPKILNKKVHGIPAGAVYVGRPSRWGNPFIIGKHGDRNQVIEIYRGWIVVQIMLYPKEYDLSELRGKDLVCWCWPKSCHAEILRELAND